jgi:steroid delta-isomerase-like uncharacterized protein
VTQRAGGARTRCATPRESGSSATGRPGAVRGQPDPACSAGLLGESNPHTIGAVSSTGEDLMDHSATMRRAYDLLSAGDIDGFGELIADDLVEHEETPGLEPTKEGVKQFFHMYRAAFPDLRMEPQDVIASGDRVVVRVRATGTHQGEFMGMPATGKSFDVELIDIVRFGDDGLAHEHWGIFDALKMMQQLGAIPEPSPA